MTSALDDWIDTHFDEEVSFLQALVRVPTDTPPGDNAHHADVTATLLAGMGLNAERYPVPAAEVHAQGMTSITNLIVRSKFGATGPQATASHPPPPEGAGSTRGGPSSTRGPTIALNAHGDVVPPGEGWTHDPYGGDIVDGKLYGRAAAVSKSDFATYTFALRALAAAAPPKHGAVELHFTYDEEFGGELGAGWLLRQGLTKPDLLIAAGFSYQVITAHNGCLQLELTLHGLASHAAYPETGVDALQAANKLLTALYAHNAVLSQRRSEVPGITHPYLNVGRIEGGSNTNVVPGKVMLRLDRRMIPEENAAEVEAELHALIEQAVALSPGVRLDVKRLLLAQALKPLPGHEKLAETVQRHAQAIFSETVPLTGTPLYTDVRLYGAAGVPAVIYGAGPHTVLESNAKRADEHVVLEDLRRATKVIAHSLAELLA